MENSLKNEELTLKKILYHFRLNPSVNEFSVKKIRREMARFGLWEKKSRNVGLTDNEKIIAFQKERASSSNDAGEVNFPQAAAWASLICSGKKTLRDLIPKERALSIFDYERIKKEGIWEDDPPELKQYFHLYEAKRKERDRWNFPIPHKILKKCEKLFDSGESDQFYEEFAKIMESRMKGYSPKELSELFRPDKKREEELKAMAKPFPKGLGIPFPEKYPFGTFFLTVNILTNLYGVHPEIMDAVLTEISKIYRKAKKTQLSRKEPEILSGQVEKYQEVIEHMSHITPWEIENLESYLNTSFKNHYFQKEKQGKEIPFTDLVPPNKQGKESDEIDKIINQSVFFQEYTHYGDEIIHAKEREKESRDFGKKVRKVLKSLPQRKREVINLKNQGFTIKGMATRLGVSSKTIKRDLYELRSNPLLQALHRQYKDM